MYQQIVVLYWSMMQEEMIDQIVMKKKMMTP